MGGFSRFLLGGALGAVLGILFIRKQSLIKPVKTPEAPPASPAAVPVVAASEPIVPAAEPVFEAAPVVTPVAAPVVEAAPAAVAPPAVEPVALEPAPVAPPAPVVAVPEAVVAPEPVLEPEPVVAVVPVWTEPEPVAPPAVEPMAEPAAAPVVDVAPVAPPPPIAPAVPVWTEPVVLAEPTPTAEVPAPEPVVIAPEAVVAPEPVVTAPEPIADESHAAAWAVAGVAAAELAQVVAEPEAPEAAPEIPVVPLYVAAAEDVVEQAPVTVAPGPAAESDVEAALTAAVETSESEVVLTPQVLDEPLPGSGWETSAVFVEGEMELEELLPVIADDVRPYEGPEVASHEPVLEEDWTPLAAEAVVVPVAEPVEPPVEESTVAEVAAVMEDVAVIAEEVAAAPEDVALTPSDVALEPAEMMVSAEVAAAAEMTAATDEAEPAEVAAVSEEIVVTPEDVVPAAVEAEAPAAEEPLGEDLKSRIEETRRRIREELERPFAVVDQEEGPAEAGDLGVAATTAYAAAEYVAPEPDVAPAPVIGEPMYVNAGATDATAAPEATDASAPNGNGSDYDAMRARIELTRSRLKAKAFDAMMAGESSLLRRDPEGTATPRKSVTVDNEIEQTVESTLREEDD